jgi:hypothetical protein
VDKSLFSALLKYAYFSDECAPHFLVDTSAEPANIKRMIDDICIARNAKHHHNERSSPESRTIIFSRIVELSNIAGINLRKEDEEIDVNSV